MAGVYILRSKKLDRFYTGSCLEFQFRFEDHLQRVYPESFTTNVDDSDVILNQHIAPTELRAYHKLMFYQHPTPMAQDHPL